ncbi:MAG: hypothetical protein WCA46_27705 [Actinocatenispora sp.]
MPVEFDASAGRLRVDQVGLDRLVGLGRGDLRPADEALAELRDCGAVTSEGVHPALAPGVAAILDPVCRLRLVVRDGAGRGDSVEGWASGDAAALVLDAPDGLCEFVTVHPTFLPAAIGRVVGLGPHRRLRVPPVTLSPGRLEDLISPDPARRAGAVRQTCAEAPGNGVEDAVAALGSGLRRRWDVYVTWPPATDSVGERSVHVLDTEDGLWSLEPAADGGVLVGPTTATVVWRALVLLLPRDEEYGRPTRRASAAPGR